MRWGLISMIGGGAAALYFGGGLARLADAGNKLMMEVTSLKFVKFNGLSPVFELNTLHRNPTGKDITLDYIFLDLMTENGTVFGSVNADVKAELERASSAADKAAIQSRYTIKGNTSNNITMLVDLKPISVLMTITDMIKGGFQNGTLPKTVTAKGYIKAGGIEVPYNSKVLG